jgi:hypothetical protein
MNLTYGHLLAHLLHEWLRLNFVLKLDKVIVRLAKVSSENACSAYVYQSWNLISISDELGSTQRQLN